jgi:hypothetical protein
MTTKIVHTLLVLLVLTFTVADVDGARFVSNGPVITVTLKDSQNNDDDDDPRYLIPSSSSTDDGMDGTKPWFNLDNLRPNLVWSIQSQGKPLPNWIPNWHYLRTTIGYQYETMKRLPSFVEADLRFSSEQTGVNLQVNPSYEFDTQRSILLVQLSRGASAYIMGKFASKKDRWCQLVRGCYQAKLPYGSVGAVRLTPTLDLARGQASCLLEATTGSERTKAVLNLEYDNPTLSVVHSLDDR